MSAANADRARRVGAGLVEDCTQRIAQSVSPWTGHLQTTITYGEMSAVVDVGVADDVLSLWALGIPTVASCTGLGADYPRNIVVEAGADWRAAADVLPWVTRVSRTGDGNYLLGGAQ